MLKKSFYISLILFALASFSFGQKVSPAKQKIATEITTNTIDIIPIDFFENIFGAVNDALQEAFEKSVSEGILEKISQKKTLTDEEKNVLKPKIDEFSKKMAKSMQDVIFKNFDIRTASTDSLKANYEKTFTLAELQKLNAMFKTPNGKRFVRRFKEMTNAKLEGKEPKMTNADMKMFEQISKVISLKIFGKFTKVLIPNTMDDIETFVKNWSDTAKGSMDKDLDEQNLKAQIDQFVAENSK